MYTRILNKHGHEDGQNVHVPILIVNNPPAHGHEDGQSVHVKKGSNPYIFYSGHISGKDVWIFRRFSQFIKQWSLEQTVSS